MFAADEEEEDEREGGKRGVEAQVRWVGVRERGER